MSNLLFFPGQGAQTVGMAKDACEAYDYAMDMANQANDIVGYDLKTLCFEGPVEDLSQTKTCQAAIFLASAIFHEVIKREKGWGDVAGVAGLSLGEYTALYAAGSLSFEDGLTLVQRRGELMQEAGEKSPGTMASLLGLDIEGVQALCDSVEGYVVPANLNCPGQIVVSGEIDAVRALVAKAKEQKSKAIELSVSGAFHSDLMQHAAEGLAQALADVDIKVPNCAFTANVTAEFVSDPAIIREGLIKQLTGSVLWEKCVNAWLAKDGSVDFTYYEVGPNKVLTGLMRKINRETKVTPINSLDSAKALIDA